MPKILKNSEKSFVEKERLQYLKFFIIYDIIKAYEEIFT